MAEAVRRRHVSSLIGRYAVFLAAFLAGCIVTVATAFVYILVYMSEGPLRGFRSYLGYNVIDSGTAWQWTFNIMLWALPAIPLCRLILGAMSGVRPAWWRMGVGYLALGLVTYGFGQLAYATNIDRVLLRIAGLIVILTAGYWFTCRWIVRP